MLASKDRLTNRTHQRQKQARGPDAQQQHYRPEAENSHEEGGVWTPRTATNSWCLIPPHKKGLNVNSKSAEFSEGTGSYLYILGIGKNVSNQT